MALLENLNFTDFEINLDSMFDGVWEKITYPGHYVLNQLAIYQSPEKKEKRNPLAENPAEYLKILAEIESHCSEKDQSCGPSLSYWEREKIENSVNKFTRWAPANRFAQVIKNFVIKRKTKPPGKLTNFNVNFSHVMIFLYIAHIKKLMFLHSRRINGLSTRDEFELEFPELSRAGLLRF